MASYLAVADFLTRSDIVSLGMLVARGTPGGKTVAIPVTATSLLTDPILAAALLDASGLVLSACTQGDRYTHGDLLGLAGTAQAALYRLVTRLTVCLLWEDRMMWQGRDEIPQPVFYEAAYEDLDRLRRGLKLFAV